MLWLLFTAVAHAACGTYEFQGIPRLEDGRLELVIAEGARSERVFTTDASEQAKLAPFLGREVRGEFVLTAVTAPHAAVVTELTNLDDATPDPLNPHTATFLKPKDARPCE